VYLPENAPLPLFLARSFGANSQLLVLPGSKNFTSSLVILMLPPVPLNHYSAMRASGIDRVLFRYSMRFHSGGTREGEHGLLLALCVLQSNYEIPGNVEGKTR